MLNKQNGFSLVELSIVITIIGLLVAGTLAGKGVVDSMKLKSLISKVNEYKGALDQFKLKYDGLPGDISDASDYWGGATNGDKDGTIDAETSNEPFAALKQLVDGGFINVRGTLTGAYGTGFVSAEEGVSGNVPFAGSGNELIYVRCCSGTDYARTMSYNNYIALFSIYSAANAYRAGVISPTNAFNIDNKVDDGKPDYGFVGASSSWDGAVYSTTTACYTGTGATSAYQSANATYKNVAGCQMQFAYDWDM